jgi:uncharacterized protein (TIGR03435 family)
MRLTLALMLLASAVFAQGSFVVSTIRPSDPGNIENGLLRTQFAGPTFIANGYSLKRLILHAYDLQEFQVTGGPGWVGTDGFDIAAKVLEGDDSSVDANRTRLRALLTERFGLVVHRETRQATTLVLEFNKGGSKLIPHREGEPERTSSGVQQVIATGAEMGELARILSARLARPVVDKTGLSGKFDFTLQWDMNSDKGNGPSVFTALGEQLGLRLESEKGPIEVLVVDRAERPTDN